MDNPTINPQENPFVLHPLAAVAELEQKQISRRTKDALQAAKRRGQVLGKHGKVLAQKNREAADHFARELQPLIYELKEAGFVTVQALVGEMNQRNIPTYQTGSNWHRTTVHSLLKRV